MIKALHPHYQMHLLSGDNDRERQQLAPYFQYLHFNQAPIEKLEYLKNLEEKGYHTLMVGDGLNDAGALKQSHVGIAIADDVHHFSPACDGILKASSFQKLPQFLKFSKFSMKVVWIAFTLSFLYNVVGISFAVSGWLTPLIAAILMPLSSITVVVMITFAIGYQASKHLK
jgi:Cu+-exporting ATPase